MVDTLGSLKVRVATVLQHMGYVKRKVCSKAKVTVPNFDEVRANFLCNIKAIVEMEETSLSLILNWDHTRLKYICIIFFLDSG